ncbi:MAG TPA: aspartate aminotransferase family protein [Verrucomicrobiae bacterium]|nr:aspartate aminotransferase family protein [Verrucomicrobiae bacterium]
MTTKELYDQYMITSMVAGFEPIEVERAQGTTITGRDGKTYLDCFSGISVVNAGHNHPKVVAAAKAQMDKLVHCCTYVYYNPPAGLLAKRMAEITPGKLQKTFFANSGAEAIEGAMRLAKQFTGKKELVALTQSFHGRTVGTLSVTGNLARKKGSGPYLSGVAFAPAPHFYRCPFKTKTPDECAAACAEAIDDAIRSQTSGDVAAFIAESVLGEGGIIVPPDNYFKYAKAVCDKHGLLFICDEVQSGFGRTGKLFAIEHYGVEPDIMCTAKGIADGFPLGAFTARPDVGGAFKPGDHLSTFGGSPVSCAAALANIDVMFDEKLPENAAVRGAQIMKRLQKVAENTPLIGDVRGKGLMIGVELVKPESARGRGVRAANKQKTPAAAETKEVRRLCREAGVLVGAGGTFANVIRLQPPLTLSAAEADRICDVLSDAVAKASGGKK